MFKVMLATLLLFASIADADEIREISEQAKQCISEPDAVHAGIDRLKTNGDQVVIGSINRLYDPPNEETSPDGFLIAGLIGWHVKWIAIFDANTSPPTFHNSRDGEGVLFWTGLPKEVKRSLTGCGFHFGGDSGQPSIQNRSKPERNYPDFELPKIDWD